MTGKSRNSCAHLEWVDGDRDANSGYMCNKLRPNETEDQDDVRTARMEDERYLSRGKSCCVQKEPRP